MSISTGEQLLEELPPSVAERTDSRAKYQLVRKIGEGGHGEVYLGRQNFPIRRQVAVKFLKAEVRSTGAWARFEGESQTLAMMDHPSICRVLDAGATTQGRPFHVMEWVDGQRITEFCRHHGLPLYERIRLFVEVCHAVAHAHRRGIIHRDLKPGNILVSKAESGLPRPKVIDFGTSKALQRPGMEGYTRDGQVLGTPNYMSPEQARGDVRAIDTRADVYALGAILYELITGRVPIDCQTDSSGWHTAVSRIETETIHRPSRVMSEHQPTKGDAIESISRIRSELDWIILKALEREPARRYAAVDDLAGDLERFLNNQPIEARPPSVLYRAGKWARRHRTGLLTALAVVMVILAAGGGVAEVRRRQIVQTRETISGLRSEAKQAMNDERYALAGEAYTKILALDPDNRAAREGADRAKQSAAIAASLARIERDIANQQYERAIGEARGLVARFPDDPRTIEAMDRAVGKTTLHVEFALGELTAAAIGRVRVEGVSLDPLDIATLTSPGGVDILPGLWKLRLEYRDKAGARAVREHVLLVVRSTPVRLDVRIREASLEDLDEDGQLSGVLASLRPGNILQLSPGNYPCPGDVLRTSNVTITSADPNEPAELGPGRGEQSLHIARCWDVTLENLVINGDYTHEGWPAMIKVRDAALVTARRCQFLQAAMDVEDSTMIRAVGNRFPAGKVGWVHHRMVVTRSRGVYLQDNTVPSGGRSYGWRGVLLEDCDDVVAVGNRFSSIALTALHLTNCDRLLIAGNRFSHQGEDSLRLEGCRNATIAMNEIVTHERQAMNLALCKDVHVLDNIVLARQKAVGIYQSNAVFRRNVLHGRHAVLDLSGGEIRLLGNVLSSPRALMQSSAKFWNWVVLGENVQGKEFEKARVLNLRLDDKGGNAVHDVSALDDPNQTTWDPNAPKLPPNLPPAAVRCCPDRELSRSYLRLVRQVAEDHARLSRTSQARKALAELQPEGLWPRLVDETVYRLDGQHLLVEWQADYRRRVRSEHWLAGQWPQAMQVARWQRMLHVDANDPDTTSGVTWQTVEGDESWVLRKGALRLDDPNAPADHRKLGFGRGRETPEVLRVVVEGRSALPGASRSGYTTLGLVLQQNSTRLGSGVSLRLEKSGFMVQCNGVRMLSGRSRRIQPGRWHRLELYLVGRWMSVSVDGESHALMLPETWKLRKPTANDFLVVVWTYGPKPSLAEYRLVEAWKAENPDEVLDVLGASAGRQSKGSQ